MVDFSTRDLICRYLAVQDAGSQSPAPRSVTAAGIGDALELGDTATARVELLNHLESLRDGGLLAAEERPIIGQETPRTVYFLTDKGRRHAESFYDTVCSETVMIPSGTDEEISLADVDQYFEKVEAPVVRALTRLDEDGRVHLERRVGRQFVDRREELATVRSDITASFERESRTIAISGAGGMGKTTLVQETLTGVSEDHDPVAAWGACTTGPTDPYAPIERAFDALPDDDELHARLARVREEATSTDADRVEAEREALFDEIADVLRETAAETPVVLILDNVQWADVATLQLFVHLATTITEWLYPIAFVVTHRPTTPAADEELISVLDRLRDTDVYNRVELDPFNSDDTEALLASTIGHQEFPAEFVDLIQDHTGGIPLFVEETASTLAESDVVEPHAEQYPKSAESLGLSDEVVDHIDERIGSLDAEARKLVRLCAVIGEYIPGRVLAEASELPAARRREYEDALVASRVLEYAGARTEGGPAETDEARVANGDFRFASGVAREAVVEGLAAERVRSFHARIAEAFTSVHEGHLDAHAARIAHHYDQASNPERAIEFYRLAGEHARETYAHQDAVTNYERALELSQDIDADADVAPAVIARQIAEIKATIGDAEGAIKQVEGGLDFAAPDSHERCRLLEVKADAQRSRGDYDSARETAQEQLRLAEDLGAQGLEADALRHLGIIARRQVEPEAAREHLQAALDAYTEIEDHRGIATVTKRLGNVSLGRGELATARELYERALETFESLDDPRGIASVQNNLGLVTKAEGDITRAREYFEQALEGFETVGERQNAAIAHLHLGACAHESQDPAAAKQQYERSLSIHESIDATHGIAETHKRLGTHEYWQGEYEAARDHFEQALKGYETVGDREGVAEAILNVGKTAHMLCDDEAARERYDAARGIFSDIDSRDGVATVDIERARNAMRRCDYQAARDYLTDAREDMEAVGNPAGEARATLYLGDVELAEGDSPTDLAEYRDAMRTLDSEGDLRTAAVGRIVFARLALELNDCDTAREVTRTALETFVEIEATHWIGRSRALLGRVAASVGEDKAAREHWNEALDAFEAVAAPQDALPVLNVLVSARLERDLPVENLCRKAEALLSEVPDSVADRNRAVVADCGLDPNDLG